MRKVSGARRALDAQPGRSDFDRAYCFLLVGTVLLLLLLGGAIYFVPTWIATQRGHSKFSSIFVVNLFLGWSLIGWVVALAWAFTEDNSPEAILRELDQYDVVDDDDADEEQLPYDRLIKLHELFERGALTEDEYNAAKAKLLAD